MKIFAQRWSLRKVCRMTSFFLLASDIAAVVALLFDAVTFAGLVFYIVIKSVSDECYQNLGSAYLARWFGRKCMVVCFFFGLYKNELMVDDEMY